MSTSILTAQTLPQDYTVNALASQTNVSGLGGIALELTITNSSTPPLWGKQVYLVYAFSGLNLTANTAQPQLTDIGILKVTVNPLASGVATGVTPPILVGNDYLYTWLAVPDPLTNSVTVGLTLSTLTLGSNQIFSGNYGGAAPTFTPSVSIAYATDTSNSYMWQWFNGAWH